MGGKLPRTAAALAVGTLVAVGSAEAQTFEVRGVVADSAGAGLPSAMVVALTAEDSVLTKWATTGGDGSFALRRLDPGDYILQATAIGFEPYRARFSIGTADFIADTIRMSPQVHVLDAIEVNAEHLPFVVRRDTLEYSVDAFETPPQAVVEDLLRRLPGIEVEPDGTITAQGEEVENVLVEGREFFDSDPSIATRNIPADVVERVQVYDRQSDMAEFTGIPDGEQQRTINLELREGATTGYFGRMSGGLGGENEDRGRYDGVASLNRFSLTNQLALIANVNDVNRPGFSWGDYLSFIGGMQGFAASGGRDNLQIGGRPTDGFTETIAAGFNASRDFGGERWIRSSYFLSSLDNTQDRTIQEQQLLGSDVTSFANQNSSQTSDNSAHRVNLNGQYRFAPGHDLRVRANLNVVSSTLGLSSSRETFDGAMTPVNTSATNYDTSGDELGGNVQLTWRRRLGESGQSIVFEGRANLNDTELAADLASSTEFVVPGKTFTIEDIQEQSRIGNTLTHAQRLSFIQPFGAGRMLELFGERSVVDEDLDKSFFDLSSGSPVLDEALSTGFERTYTYLRGGLRFNRNTPSNWLVLGLQVQNSDLDGRVPDQQQQIANGFTHLLPYANFRVQLRTGKSFDARYTTGTREPSMVELQPFVDNSDPLFVYAGNPELIPEYTHTVAVNFRSYDQFTLTNFFTFARVSLTRDNIVQSRTVDEELATQEVTPVNSDRGWSVTGGFNFGTPIRPLDLRLTLANRATYSTGSEFINDAENVSRILSNSFTVGVDNQFKEIFDIRASATLTFNNVDYSLNEELNQDYLNSTLNASGTYYVGDSWMFTSAIDYRVFDQDVFGQGDNVALWNASISRFFLDGRAQLELVGIDLLDQNQGVSFSSSSTSIQEERIVSLGRYVMLKFNYRLSDFGGRGR